jgi:predicted transcriptional regulator of viral defense system
MTHPESRHRPIEFSGSVAELAHTLGMAVEDITASIGALIERGHLQQISNGVYRMVLKPVR